jgi:hypothetical protein
MLHCARDCNAGLSRATVLKGHGFSRAANAAI